MTSQELLYLLTRNNNAFLRKNMHGTYTTDIFSAKNTTRRSDPGFICPKSIGFTSSNEKGKNNVVR